MNRFLPLGNFGICKALTLREGTQMWGQRRGRRWGAGSAFSLYPPRFSKFQGSSFGAIFDSESSSQVKVRPRTVFLRWTWLYPGWELHGGGVLELAFGTWQKSQDRYSGRIFWVQVSVVMGGDRSQGTCSAVWHWRVESAWHQSGCLGPGRGPCHRCLTGSAHVVAFPAGRNIGKRMNLGGKVTEMGVCRFRPPSILPPASVHSTSVSLSEIPMCFPREAGFMIKQVQEIWD